MPIHRITRGLPDGSTVTEDIPGSLTINDHHITIYNEGIVFSAHVDHVVSVRDITRIGSGPAPEDREEAEYE